MPITSAFDLDTWQPSCDYQQLLEMVFALENGQILTFPKLAFSLTEKEKALFSPSLVKPGHKHVSFDLKSNTLKNCEGPLDTQNLMREMIKRFATYAIQFVDLILPSYESHLIPIKTSFRPIEVKDRKNPSYRKDDTLLHLDSFPSSPTKGKRILRFFANVNPEGQPRVWKVGESYSKVLRRFIPKTKKPFFGSRQLLNRLGLTKSYRVLYDHYMLQIHNFMKADQTYQEKVDQEIITFPASSCWMAFTDQVSHAALSGQHLFEQSFYLPIEAQKNPEKSPLHYMEELFQQRLRS